nr:FAD-dependent oxidoreductase [Devosia sp.]
MQRFKERQSHLIWLEPEGLETSVVYPNGISVSLPVDVQMRMLRTIRGLEKVEMIRPGTTLLSFNILIDEPGDRLRSGVRLCGPA